jgi:hypothetical protein
MGANPSDDAMTSNAPPTEVPSSASATESSADKTEGQNRSDLGSACGASGLHNLEDGQLAADVSAPTEASAKDDPSEDSDEWPDDPHSDSNPDEEDRILVVTIHRNQPGAEAQFEDGQLAPKTSASSTPPPPHPHPTDARGSPTSMNSNDSSPRGGDNS